MAYRLPTVMPGPFSPRKPKPNERVSDHAAMLDEIKPGWYQQINLRKLDLECSDRCVLGQVYGSYEQGVFELNATYPRINRLVFHDLGSSRNHKAWKNEIKRRRGERNAVDSG